MYPPRLLPRFALLALLSLPTVARAADPGVDLKRYEAMMTEATQAAKKGDHAGALAAYDRALAVKPNDQAALTDQGWSAFQLHQLDRAEAITRRAIAAGDDQRRSAAAQYNLGRILQERGNKPGAVAAYQASIKLRPNRVVSARLAGLDPAASGFSTDKLEDLDQGQKAQLIKLLAGGGFAQGPVIGKLWPRREKTYLVAGLAPPDEEGRPTLHLAAFDLSVPSIRRLASIDPVVLGRDDTLDGFDLAAYRLTAKEYAFAVRIARNRYYGGGSATLDNAMFFRLNGKAIEPILNTLMAFNADIAGDWNEDGTRNHDEYLGKAVIVVRDHKTGGYFDWAKKVEGARRAQPLVWKAGQYQTKGADPIYPKEELEIFSDD
jgi:tetratricopeptide (TPR) repeat protein